MGSAPRHKVFARTVEGRWITHPSLGFVDWRQAVAAQRVLEDARLAGRLPLIANVVVRASNDPDPRYAQAQDDLAPFFIGRLRGLASLEAAAKKRAEGSFVGKEGGWIYRADPGMGKPRVICQGWASLDAHRGWSKRGEIVVAVVAARKPRYEGQRETRYFVNDLRTIDADSVLGPQHETVEV